jgi:hypothetical protein
VKKFVTLDEMLKEYGMESNKQTFCIRCGMSVPSPFQEGHDETFHPAPWITVGPKTV